MYGSNAKWKTSSEKYTRSQVKAVLADMGIQVHSETHTNFLTYCPFHGNRDTPSFTVSATSGLYICFNPACDESGNLIHLVKHMTGRNDFEAMRFIKKMAGEAQEATNADLIKAQQPFEWTEWHPELLAKMRAAFPGSPGEKYMVEERKFALDTLDHFEVGYSEKQDMVAVPLHSPNGIPVGIIGRGISQKVFKNSGGLPRNKTLFNLNRAKKYGDIAIVTESAFDTMHNHQAGFPNTVGTLGGSISPENLANLDRYFNMIIIMTDWDNREDHINPKCRVHGFGQCPGHNPGRELGMTIANALRNKNIMWAVSGYKEVYPPGVKDSGQMTNEQKAHCIENAISHLEYVSWGLDFQ